MSISLYVDLFMCLIWTKDKAFKRLYPLCLLLAFFIFKEIREKQKNRRRELRIVEDKKKIREKKKWRPWKDLRYWIGSFEYLCFLHHQSPEVC